MTSSSAERGQEVQRRNSPTSSDNMTLTRPRKLSLVSRRRLKKSHTLQTIGRGEFTCIYSHWASKYGM